MITLRLIMLMWLSLIAACAPVHHQPQPILERIDRQLGVGDPTASRDLDACRAEIREAAPMSIQPRWLPPLGVTDSGVVFGTIDNTHPAWPSQDAYRQALTRCLIARGYQIRGW
ncbi:MAG: hypothetical protein OJF50_003721 [Nitrospira sp.]|nr:hypothetical protein [Nitrospira sp.]